MKTAASRLRQNIFCSKRSWWTRVVTPRSSLLADELEVDVLERRPSHLELLELASGRERRRRQLVEHARRIVASRPRRARRRGGSGSPSTPESPMSSAGRSLPDDLAVAEHRDAVGELLRLVEVVRRQEDRRAERAKRADHVPRGAARGRVEARRRLVEEDEIGIARRARRRGRAAASALPRASSRARRASRRARRAR